MVEPRIGRPAGLTIGVGDPLAALLGTGAEDATITDEAGRRIAYLVRGPKDGRAVVYLHGWPGSRYEQVFALRSEVLVRFGLRVLSIDRPGYGGTDPVVGDRLDRARDVVTVCDRLGMESFTVMAISAGGTNGLALAIAAAGRVRRVVLVSAQMPYDDEAAIATLNAEDTAELPIFRRGRTPDLEADAETFRTQLLADPLGFLDDATASVSAPEATLLRRTRTRLSLAADMSEAVRQTSEGLIEDALACVRPFEFDTGAIACPVLAVHGSADDWEPLPNLVRVLAGIHDTQLIVLDGRNHFGPYLYPNLLASLALGG